MCPPTFYGVNYVINPHMEGNVGHADQALAQKQWNDLRGLIEQTGAETVCMQPVPGLPDLVFTANGGLVYSNRFVVPRFRNHERQGEEPYFEAWSRAQGYNVLNVRSISRDLLFEGAGDALFMQDERGHFLPKLFLGYGQRSDDAAANALAKLLDIEVLPLRLLTGHYYHLDTCFCPLPGGRLLYYPAAFDETSLAIIHREFQANKRFAVSDSAAAKFACNAVSASPSDLIMNIAADAVLENWLLTQGFILHQTDLSEFMKAGGAAKCLTLQIGDPANI